MSDLICRQAAIDALKEHRALYCDNTPDTFSKLSYAEKSRVDELDTAIATLVNLPPIQPKRGRWEEEDEKQSEKIEVGDEVNWLGDCFVVTRIFQPRNMKEQCDGIDDDGCVYHDILMDDLEKTGRHFDILSILEAMKA